MDKKIEMIKQILIESNHNYPLYNKQFKDIQLLLKQNIKYEKNIFNYYNPDKDEQLLKIFFLLFFNHNKWINPYNVKIFYFQDFFKIIEKEKIIHWRK